MIDAKERVARHACADQEATNTVKVRVFANLADGDVVFTHDWSANGSAPEGGAIVLPKRHYDWDFDFHFYDSTGLGLEYEQDADEAIWVHKGNGCPSAKGNGDGHIKFGSVTSKKPGGPRDLLTASDDNQGSPCSLHFMLRFDSDSGKHEYDPEIKNGGTGTR